VAKKIQPLNPSGPNVLQWATLAGVVLVGAVTFTNRQAVERVEKSVDAKVASIDARVAKMQSDVAAAAAAAARQAQPQRRGPDPNQVYALKTGPGATSKGNPEAPITIVEVSDFQ
jgi:protein-disulfide isomerase